MSDSEVLRLAADDDRVLVTCDVRTMPKHFAVFTARETSPDLLLIPARVPIGEIMNGILACWRSWTAEEMRNQLRWLPR